MPSLEEQLKKNFLTPSEIRFALAAADWILQTNLMERRGVKLSEVKQHFAKNGVVYSDEFIEKTLEMLTKTIPNHVLCQVNGQWRSVTLNT